MLSVIFKYSGIDVIRDLGFRPNLLVSGMHDKILKKNLCTT